MPEPITRRGALTGAARAMATAGPAGALVPTASAAAAPVVSRGRTKVVVLGSLGGQQMTQLAGAGARCGTSVLIDVDGVLTIVDCGCGSAHRITEAGYDLSAVRNVIVTHFHVDHVADLGPIATLAWSSGRNGAEPDRRLDVYGPTGTRAYQRGITRALGISISDQEGALGQRPAFERYARWHEIEPPRRARRLFADRRFDVRALRVQHGGVPAVGYRIRTPDLDLGFSGDRGAHGDRFAGFVKGADVLFHEVIDRSTVLPVLRGQGVAQTFIDHLVEDHCDPATVGRLATRAGVGALVLYHLIPGNPAISDDAWRAKVSPFYAGPVVVARDLLVV
jgi:ribonuclease BN (tRNA processing enzyme)